jgi:hypothetical protein
MKALQLHYTSCRRGRSGSAGFQTRAATPGIRPEEQREIERRGLYRPPRDAAPEPSADEIARDFPRALRFYTLESGRRALTLSVYSGRDYSGRWGNFFAHTLVLENGLVPSRWPIDYYEWSDWKLALVPEEDTEREPEAPPVVDLGEVGPAESFQLAEISTFLREAPGRVELLARMARAVLLGVGSSRAVVIRDTPTNNLYWIASLQKLFPPRHAAELSYSTYQDDPRDCADVNATCGETGFTWSETERRYQFYMFDVLGGSESEVPAATDDYPALAARRLAEDPDDLKRFFEFMGFFVHRRIEPELVSAIHLFELRSERELPLTGETLAAMIRFAATHATVEGRATLLETVAAALERSGGLQRAEDYAGVIHFLVDGAELTRQPRHRTLAFAAWLQLLDEHLLRQTRGLDVAVAGWNHFARMPATARAELVRGFLEPKRWSRWQPSLPELPPEILTFLLRLAWHCLDAVGRRPAWEQPEIEGLTTALVQGSDDLVTRAQSLLEAVPADGEALAAMASLAARSHGRGDPKSCGAVGQAIGRLLSHLDNSVAAATRRNLDAAEAWDVLFGEWLEICGTTRNLLDAFRRYEQSVLAVLPGYDSRCRARVAESVLELLPEKERVSLALDWVRRDEIDRFPDDLSRRAIELANRAVPLTRNGRDGDETARLVAEAAGRLRIGLQPDRPRLRRILGSVKVARSLADLDLAAVEPALAGLAPADYEEFLEGFLQPAFLLTGNRNEQQKLLVATVRSEHLSLFEEAYRDALRLRHKTPWPECLQSVLKLWLDFDGKAAETRSLAPLEKVALDELARILSKLPEKHYKTVQKRVARLSGRAAARWRALQAAVTERQRGPLARLKDFFRRRAL